MDLLFISRRAERQKGLVAEMQAMHRVRDQMTDITDKDLLIFKQMDTLVNLKTFKDRLWFKRVQFTKHLVRIYEKNKASWHEEKVNTFGGVLFGHIVGVRWLQKGRRVEGYGPDSFGEVDPPEWREEGMRTVAILVLTGPERKPFKVLPTNIRVPVIGEASNDQASLT